MENKNSRTKRKVDRVGNIENLLGFGFIALIVIIAVGLTLGCIGEEKPEEEPEPEPTPSEPKEEAKPEELAMDQINLLLQKAEESKEKGDFSAARLSLKEVSGLALKYNRTDIVEEISFAQSDNSRRWGDSKRISGDYGGAIEKYTEALDENKNNTGAILGLINANEESDNHDAAMDYVETLEKLTDGYSPEVCGFCCLFCCCNHQSNKNYPPEDALVDEYGDYAIEINNDALASIEAENLDIGIENLRMALAFSNAVNDTDLTATIIDNLVTAENNGAISDLELGDIDSATERVNYGITVLEDNPDTVSDMVASGIYTTKAITDFLAENYDSALKHALKSIEYGENPVADNIMAVYNFEIENYELAYDYAQKALNLDPGNPVYIENAELIEGVIDGSIDPADVELSTGVEIGEIPIEPEPLEPIPLEPVPTAGDSDGDALNDTYEIKWELDPNNPDENDNGILDGYDDFDEDLFLTKSEMLIDSNPFDPGDPNLDDMIEVEAGSEIVDLPEGKDVYCYIKCCCVVELRYFGSCSKWGSSVPETPGPHGAGWSPVNYGNYSYTGPSGCTSCDGSVSGDYHRYGGDGEDGEYSCSDTLKWEKEFKGVNEECEKPEEEFCKEKFGAECDKNKIKADAVAGDAIKKCVEDAKNACDGKLTVNNDCSSEVRSGSC